MNATTTTTTNDGRVWTLTPMATSAKLAEDLLSRGWDGAFGGDSAPVGRQRKAMTALFYRAADTGEFVLITRV